MPVNQPDEPSGVSPKSSNTNAPLIVLFERDDTIPILLLSQLRMAGYDVRAARTPVELFGMLSKQLVALLLVDLGNATAGRREFWVALDAQRRSRPLQVMTFRYTASGHMLDPDFEPAARALADVEVQGAHEFQKIIDSVRQRIPLNGVPPSSDGIVPISDVPASRFTYHQASAGATPATVFISYSRKDGEFVQQLVGDLQAAGIQVWVDHERLKSGTPDWELAIRRGITSANGVIYVGSEDAMSSMYVRSELTVAHDNGIPIHAIWARGATWSNCAPFRLMPAQYTDARGDKYASAIQSVILDVKKANGTE